MRFVRSTMLVGAVAVALLGTTTLPAHAAYGVDAEFRISGGEGTALWPAVAVTPRLDGDPTTLVGTLKGALGDGEIDPGSCHLALSPSGDGTSGSATFGNCATTSVALAFDYVVDPATGQLTGSVTTAGAGPTAAPRYRFECWIEWPPPSFGCGFSAVV